MKKIINTEKAPQPIGPYSQAVQFGNMLFVSGQIALNPVTGLLQMDSLEEETRLVMQNLKEVLSAAGFGFEDIIKSSIFLSDMSLFNEVNEIYATAFESDFPARETVAVMGLPKGVNVEISVVAGKT
ncbi:MAG: 2-iminobutanoate/2-iminopropanoate deaminase [Flavobacteriales bacterium]|jgi:2-iminobutanoate/2-iminopropanoate deaminase